jgi:Tol biopolymer transport system component
MNLPRHTDAGGPRPKAPLTIMITMSGLIRSLVLCAFMVQLVVGSGAQAATDKTALPAAKMFAPGWTSGQSQDEPPTFSPDGQTLFFQRSDGHVSTILVSHLVDGRWSTPAVAPFSGSSSDQFPVMAPDGTYLVFDSDRGSDAKNRVANLWRVDKTSSGWSAPARLPDTVNISKRIYAHSIDANGDIYFMSSTEPRGQDPKWRLYRAASLAGGYAQAAALPFSDGSTSDVDPYIAPDQSYLIFSSAKRREPIDHEHLFIVFRQGADWGPVVPIRYQGDEQADDDNYSDVSPDGKTLYFDSTRNGKSNIWMLPLAPYLSTAAPAAIANASDAVVLAAPKIFAPGVISGPGNDGTPTFSPDERTLYFYRYGATPTSAVILESHRSGAEWSEPIVAPFSGPSSDRQPAFSPDGRTLVYVSLRQLPGSSGEPIKYASSLWRVVRTASGWSAPERLPDAVNISQRMHNPSIAANGDLYFTCPTTRPGQDQTWGLYRAAYRNGSYERAQPLSFSDGDVLDADDPAIAPDQSYLIFGSHGLRPPLGEEHLFISFRMGTSWGPAIQIRYDGDDWPSQNGNGDGEPQMGPDGSTLYFDSSRTKPIDLNRTRAQFLSDAERLDVWDNGNSNVWMLPLRPLLDALHRRQEEHANGAE